MITREHVRELLESRAERPTLVVVEGRARIVPESELSEGPYRGALEVITQDDMISRLDPAGTASDQELGLLASRLEAMVTELGA